MVGGRGQKTPKVPHLAHDSQKCYFLSGDVEKATGISVYCWVAVWMWSCWSKTSGRDKVSVSAMSTCRQLAALFIGFYISSAKTDLTLNDVAGSVIQHG